MFGRRPLRCSFCGKDESQVLKLVAGPRVYICDACVATARDIMERSNDIGGSAPRVSPSWWRRLLERIFIDRTFPLEKAADAFRIMKAGQHFGKIVVTP